MDIYIYIFLCRDCFYSSKNVEKYVIVKSPSQYCLPFRRYILTFVGTCKPVKHFSFTKHLKYQLNIGIHSSFKMSECEYFLSSLAPNARIYTGWPIKNPPGTAYSQHYVDAISGISVLGTFSWEKWYKISHFGSVVCFLGHIFCEAMSSPKIFPS